MSIKNSRISTRTASQKLRIAHSKAFGEIYSL